MSMIDPVSSRPDSRAAAICTAKNRAGAPCRAIAMANGKCKNHGGKSTGPRYNYKNNAKSPHPKYGIYASSLTDEELNLEIQIGNVDSELYMARIQLKRVLDAEQKWCDDPDTRESQMNLEESKESSEVSDDGTKSSSSSIRRRPDFDGMKNRFMNRIESLEKTRRELGTSGDTPDETADKIRRALMAMEETVPGDAQS